MKAETEVWQSMTHDGVYQADLPTLKQWVAEGLVLPTDKVRKGALKWIEAGRAPLLRRVFAGDEPGRERRRDAAGRHATLTRGPRPRARARRGGALGGALRTRPDRGPPHLRTKRGRLQGRRRSLPSPSSTRGHFTPSGGDRRSAARAARPSAARARTASGRAACCSAPCCGASATRSKS